MLKSGSDVKTERVGSGSVYLRELGDLLRNLSTTVKALNSKKLELVWGFGNFLNVTYFTFKVFGLKAMPAPRNSLTE